MAHHRNAPGWLLGTKGLSNRSETYSSHQIEAPESLNTQQPYHTISSCCTPHDETWRSGKGHPLGRWHENSGGAKQPSLSARRYLRDNRFQSTNHMLPSIAFPGCANSSDVLVFCGPNARLLHQTAPLMK